MGNLDFLSQEQQNVWLLKCLLKKKALTGQLLEILEILEILKIEIE